MIRRQLAAVFLRECASMMRGSRVALLLTLTAGLLLIVARLIYQLLIGGLDRGAPLAGTQIGQALFICLSLGLQCMVLVVAPAVTLGAISGERERGTLATLAATPLAPGALLIGKLLAGLALLALLLLATLPVFSVVLLFGGVDPGDLGAALATLLATAALGAIFGLCCSAAARSTAGAALLCYATLASLVSGLLAAATIWPQLAAGQGAPPPLLAASPLAAMAAALAPIRPPDLALTGALRPLLLLSLLARGAADPAAAAPPLYRLSIMLYGALGLLLLWLALRLLRPPGRPRLARADLALIAAGLAYGLLVALARPWWAL